jgi:16S rRNA (adenine1518-N6/adenine1519-N6)-dimethyltransferase
MGQHFLRDQSVARRIVAALPAQPARVLEVGPGRGALTAPLLRRFPLVRAVEFDGALAAGLAARLGNPPGLEVVRGDALTGDLDELAAGGPWLAAANLPYSVGTGILRRLLARPDLFADFVVMLQLEVAQRLTAPPGSAARGLVTVEVEMKARPVLLFEVAPRCFDPPPRVMSAVVRLAPLSVPSAAPEREARALALAATAFTHRRKKLANALASEIPTDVIGPAMARLGIDPDCRPQDLSGVRWLDLASELTGTGARLG